MRSIRISRRSAHDLIPWLISAMVLVAGSVTAALGQESGDPGWWMTPHRMLQTNLREIDATMDTDQYVREVQGFGANIVLFNVGGIVANYPTELEFHWRNTFMEGDLVGTVLPKLHDAGLKMMGRFDFSKINSMFAGRHPDWLYVSEKGENVDYNGQVHTCLMGGYQQDYMFKILEEATTRYPLDGVFFNMIGFPQTDYSRVFHGVCQCDNCRTSFHEFSGMDLPKHDGDSAVLRKHKEWQQFQISRQFKRVRELIKSVRGDIAICTYTQNHVDVIRKESSAPVGKETWDDLEKAQWTLLSNKGKQLSNASNHFHQMIFRHSGVAAPLHYRRLWQQMVNGAWLDFYCLGPLQRLEDRSGLRTASEIYRFHAANERWLRKTESAAEVGLLHDKGDDCRGWIQMLSEHHIPFDLVAFAHSDLRRYKALIVPASGRVSAEGARALDAYVRDGGKLLLSGRMPKSLECLGELVLEKTWPERHSMYVRIRPEDKAALSMDGLRDFDLVQLRGEFFGYSGGTDAKAMMRLIHDVTYGPPEKCYIHSVSDVPALWLRSHGNGMAAMLPFQIGAMYREWGNQGHALLAVGTLENLLKTGRRLQVAAPPVVEVSHRRDPDSSFEWIGLLNHSGHLENATHPPVPVSDIRIRLQTDRPVKRIVSLRDGKPLSDLDASNARLEVVLPRLEAFEIVLVEYAP